MSMSHDEARQLVARVLGGVFDLAAFRQLIANIFPADSLLEDKPISGQYIPEKFRDDVASFRRLVRHEAEGLRMDVLVVKLRSAAKLTRARFMQRNFVARYLNGGWGGTERMPLLWLFIAAMPTNGVFPLSTRNISGETTDCARRFPSLGVAPFL